MNRSWFRVELVGPPGAGKTTLTSALKEVDSIILGAFPDVREARNVPFFAGNSLKLLPTFLAMARKVGRRKLTAQEWAYMTILEGWPRLLERQPVLAPDTLILDQGPVYMLAELLRYDRQMWSNRAAGRWWNSVCRRWVATLHLVICLDAPDEVLIERICRRDKAHGIKANSRQWAIEFLAVYRAAQAKVLSDLSERTEIFPVFSLDTSVLSSRETVAGILDTIMQKSEKLCQRERVL